MFIASALWLISVFFLAGTGTPQFVPDSYISAMVYTGTTKWLFLVQIFIILWVLAFFSAIERFIIASTSLNWYFKGFGSDASGANGSVSICQSFGWAYRYHLGTMALGSLIVAIVNMIRILFEYAVKQAEKTSVSQNAVAKCAICVTRCYLTCLEGCIKFINEQAYIMCAINSTNFCESAKEGFYISVRHYARFTAL